MKKILFAFTAALLLFVITSCHKSNDKPTLTGKWFVQNERFQVYQDGASIYDTTASFTGDVYFEFLADGTLNTKDEDGNITADTYIYQEDLKKVTIVEDNTAYEYDVTKLTSSELALHLEESDSDGVSSYKYIDDFNFKR